MATPKSPPSSDDQSTPIPLDPAAIFPHAAGPQGSLCTPTPFPDLRANRPDGTEVVAWRGAQGGGATPGRKRRRLVMQR